MKYTVGSMIVLWRYPPSRVSPGVPRGFFLVLQVMKQTVWYTTYKCLSSLTSEVQIIRLDGDDRPVFPELE